jgi:hypothetical protein
LSQPFIRSSDRARKLISNRRNVRRITKSELQVKSKGEKISVIKLTLPNIDAICNFPQNNNNPRSAVDNRTAIFSGVSFKVGSDEAKKISKQHPKQALHFYLIVLYLPTCNY